MRNIAVLISFWLLMASAPLMMAQEAQRVNVGDNLTYGLTYSLPETAVRFTVVATCTKTEAGRFAPYAEKFLGLQDVALEDQESWQIQSITIQPVAQPDTARTFHLEFSEKGALPSFWLTADRCLWTINREPPVSSALADVVAPQEDKPARKVLKASDVINGSILKAGSKSKQAELCAQEVFSIRESRNELLKGEAETMPADGLSYQLVLDNMDAQEEAWLSLFRGETTTATVTRDFIYVPKGDVVQEMLFRFSRYLGFVEENDLAGAPYYVGVTVLEDNRLAEPADPKIRRKIEKGIAYCIPGKARIILSDGIETLATGDFPIAQFGHVERLPQSQFTDKKRPTSAQFIPSTGALQIFEQQQQ